MKLPNVQAKANVWLSNPVEVLTIDFSDGVAVQRSAHILDPGSDYTSCGWVKIGEVALDFKFTVDHTELATKAVAVMQAKVQQIHAEAQAKVTVLQEGINKLLSIGYSAEEAQASDPNDWREVVESEGWQCVKTGCGLEIIDGLGNPPRIYWGDLFHDSQGKHFLFNCSTADPQFSQPLSTVAMPILRTWADNEDFKTSYRGHPRLITGSLSNAVCDPVLFAYLN